MTNALLTKFELQFRTCVVGPRRLANLRRNCPNHSQKGE